EAIGKLYQAVMRPGDRGWVAFRSYGSYDEIISGTKPGDWYAQRANLGVTRDMADALTIAPGVTPPMPEDTAMNEPPVADTPPPSDQTPPKAQVQPASLKTPAKKKKTR